MLSLAAMSEALTYRCHEANASLLGLCTLLCNLAALLVQHALQAWVKGIITRPERVHIHAMHLLDPVTYIALARLSSNN